MKKLFALLIILISLTNILAQSKRIGTFQYQKKKGSHLARIIIFTRAFDSSKHKKTYDENSGKNLIDGRVAYGAEGMPKAEIQSIKFFFDGREIKVPRWLYADCYDPNFDSTNFRIRFGRERQEVFVTMSGADGAGGYEVVWVLRKNGRHSRFFRDTF
jgi:hypothetical protein